MIALIIAIAALWLVAGFLWFADGSATRATVDSILAETDEPIIADEDRDRAA